MVQHSPNSNVLGLLERVGLTGLLILGNPNDLRAIAHACASAPDTQSARRLIAERHGRALDLLAG